MNSSGNLFSLAGRTALITGSGQGIGRELAGGLAAAGAAIVLNGRDPAKLAVAKTELRAAGAKVAVAAFDVRDGAAAQREVARVEAEFGPVDILVNNAGLHRRAPLAEMSEQQWREVVDANLTGAFLVARAVAPRMLARGAGKIINVCSIMSELARPTTGNYAASKGGLKMLTRAMAVEWAGRGLQVNGIGPGYINTELNRPLVENPEFDAWVRKRVPAGRWGLPADLVGTAVFLASSASDYVNGQVIYVDGGLLAGV